MPHGDARWSLRFLELLSAGVIPVIIADGLRLPFDQIIDWKSIVITIPEEDLKDTNSTKILEPLMAISPEEARRRGILAYTIFYTYFNSQQAKIDGFLAAVGSLMYSESLKSRMRLPQKFAGVCTMSGKPKIPANPDRQKSLNMLHAHQIRHNLRIGADEVRLQKAVMKKARIEEMRDS